MRPNNEEIKMSEYNPNGWCILEQVTEERGTDYYVFASWSGGYLDGDSWKRNSGITKMEVDGDDYLFHGYTGSVYRCSKDTEGRISAYNGAVLNNLCEKMNATVIRVEDMNLS